MSDAARHTTPPLFNGGSEEITIAVLDGEVGTTHDSLRKARLEFIGTRPVDTGSSSGSAIQHGTAIASLLFGQPGSDAIGLAWRCRGLVRPIYREGAGGVVPASQEELARAIREVIAAGADIINISGGEMAGDRAISPALAKALSEAEEADVLVVAATGNDGCDCAHFPAAAPTVLAVGAVDVDGMILPGSNWGSHYAAHGIVAQGAGIAAAQSGGTVFHPQGTSMATAIVSGAAALLMSAGLQAGKRFGAAAVRQALIAGAQPASGTDASRFLAGRINLAGALAQLLPTFSSQPLQKKEEVIMTQITPIDAQLPEIAPSTMAAAAEMTAQIMPAAETVPAQASRLPTRDGAGLEPSAEDCPTCPKSGTEDGKLVYALGTLSYDLGSDTRRRSLTTSLDEKSLYDPAALLKDLKKASNAYLAESITWILSVDEVPMYAVRPGGAFAAEGYKQLLALLDDQLNEGAERVSLPGVLDGHVMLPSGLILPVVVPEFRGMYSWTTTELAKSLLAGVSADNLAEREEAIGNFLERVYFEVRNPGLTAPDRALNFAATQAYQIERVFERALQNNLQLDGIEVGKSPIARPGSDSWDVKLSFFNPMRRLEEARMLFRFTVDVSDVIPVMVGKVRQWRAY